MEKILSIITDIVLIVLVLAFVDTLALKVFRAYSATNMVCTVLAIVLAVCALLFDIGFLPSLMVCLVWAVNISVYCKEAMRYSKAGNKIS